MTTHPAPSPQRVSRASIQRWLLSRQPAPPPDLATKLAASVESAPDAALAGEGIAAVMGSLGTWLLGVAIERQRDAQDDAPPAGSGPGQSAAALDLLAADAFLTYAFEAASEERDDVAALASHLLAQVHA